jgi:hypothetical protein
VVLGARAALVARSKVLRARVERENLVLTPFSSISAPLGAMALESLKSRGDWNASRRRGHAP